MRLRALAVPTLVAVVVLTISMTESTLASQADADASEALASVAAQDAQAAPAAIPTPAAPLTPKSTGTIDRSSGDNTYASALAGHDEDTPPWG